MRNQIADYQKERIYNLYSTSESFRNTYNQLDDRTDVVVLVYTSTAKNSSRMKETGATYIDDDLSTKWGIKVIRIVLRAGLSSGANERTIAHEFKHAIDAANPELKTNDDYSNWVKKQDGYIEHSRNSSCYKSAYDVANRVIKQANTYKEWLKEKRDEAERLRKEHIAEIKKRDQSAAKRTNEAVKLNE